MTYFLDGPDTSGMLELGGCVHPLVVGNAELLQLRLFVLLLLVSPPSNFIIYKFKVGMYNYDSYQFQLEQKTNIVCITILVRLDLNILKFFFSLTDVTKFLQYSARLFTYSLQILGNGYVQCCLSITVDLLNVRPPLHQKFHCPLVVLAHCPTQ